MEGGFKSRLVRLPVKGHQTLFAAFLFAVSFSSPALANTSIFANAGTACSSTSWCQSLSEFGLLTGASNTFTSNGGWTFNGGIGIETGGKLSITGGNVTANDIVDFADTISRTNSNTCGTNNLCGAGKLNNQTMTATTKPATDATLVNQAATELSNIETNFLNNFNTVSYTHTFGTTGTLNVETGGQSAGSNIYVYRNTATYTQSGAITLNCGTATCNANDLIVIVLAQSSGTATLNANLLLGGGLTSDQVIFYVPSVNTSIGTSNGTGMTLNADFFFKNTETVTLGGSKTTTLNGRIYGANFTDSGGSANTQNDLGMLTPEPGSWAMMAGGLGFALWLHRRRNRSERKDA